jgi:hypothetical protein
MDEEDTARTNEYDAFWREMRNALVFYTTKWQMPFHTDLPEIRDALGWFMPAPDQAKIRVVGLGGSGSLVGEEVSGFRFTGLPGMSLQLQINPGVAREEIDGIFKRLEEQLDLVRERLANDRRGVVREWNVVFMSSLRSSVEDMRYQIHELETKLANLLWPMPLLEATLDKRSGTEPTDQELDEALAMIGSLGSIKYLGGDQFVVTTDKIRATNAEDDERSHLFGPYEIHIHANPASPRILIHSFRDGGRHPHVGGGGVPCWGNYDSRIRRALCSGRIGDVCALTRQFLEWYKPGDFYFDPDDGRDEDEDEDEDRYVNCYENATRLQCLRCGDDECPYLDEVYAACANASSVAQCADCRYSSNCTYSDQAYRSCSDDDPGMQPCWTCPAADECRGGSLTHSRCRADLEERENDSDERVKVCNACSEGDRCTFRFTKTESDEEEKV